MKKEEKFKFSVLGSGSSGNSSVLCLGDTNILIDAGISSKQINNRLNILNINPDLITGILLTHEHGDHIRGLDVFCRKRNVPVYVSSKTYKVIKDDIKSNISWNLFESGESFSIKNLKIESFSVPHDAIDPVGFVFKNNKRSLGLVTDFGHITNMIVKRLEGVNTLFVESNYDEKLLQEDTIRPWSIKQRISNKHGHLSNDQALDLILKIVSKELNNIILGHISSDCNSPDLAKNKVKTKLIEKGFGNIDIKCSDRQIPTPLEEVYNKKIKKNNNKSQKIKQTEFSLFS